ncbi:hypothetical protein AAIP55_000805 [Flavobacterium psychrophilum]|nr:hypothetical protein [Flavobacterium psychrophilum]EKT4516681.1 hypothetical protein [Flavobacterium psychrophilum]
MDISKSKLRNRIVNINNELVKLGMNEVEIFNFWDSCITKANKKREKLHCFECEIEMPVKEKNGVLSCSNCGLAYR